MCPSPSGTGPPTSGRPAEGVVRVPHGVGSVAPARRRMREALIAAGLGGRVLEDAILVASELMSNAVLHARALPDGMIAVGWCRTPSRVEIRVTDGGSGTPVEARRVANTSISGRGLRIVERVAAAWGVTDHSDRSRTVWAALALDGAAPRPRQARRA